MIEPRLANTFVSSKHKSKAFNWHALWERKEEKSCGWSYNCILRCTFKHKTITRHCHSKNKPLPVWQYFLCDFSHSHTSSIFFFFNVHHQQTAKTVIIKPLPLITQPSARFESCSLAVGGTLGSCVFFPVEFPALSPSTAGEFQMSGAHTTWGRTWTPTANPPTFYSTMCCSPHYNGNHTRVEIDPVKAKPTTGERNGCRPKSVLGEREQAYTNGSPMLLKSLVPFCGSNMWNKFCFH